MTCKNEIEILRILRKNSRTKLAEISSKLNTPLSTTLYKLRRMESKLKLRHTSLVNYERIGCHLRCFFVVKAEQKNKTKEFLQKSQFVNNLFEINSSNQFLCDTAFRSISELEEFRQELAGTKSKFSTHFIIEETERELFLANPPDGP